MSIPKYWHTLRHLRPVQIYGRLWFRLNRPKPDLRPVPMLRSPGGIWQPPIACPTSMYGASTFQFLNKAGKAERKEDWNAPEQDKLWLYNLHYFDDLNALGADERKSWHEALIDRWIDENSPGLGNGWEPYPLSLRTVNWMKWALAGNDLKPEWQHSLGVQVRLLAKRLEWHLLGNHLFANTKALVFAGLFFEGPEADRWLAKGLAILAREIPEQILPDGGHFELSPMYHAIILEDLLDLINMARTCPEIVPASLCQEWCKTAEKMRGWLLNMSHPDGRIAFFNDAAFAVASEPHQLEEYAMRLDLAPMGPLADSVTHLADSGYIRVQQEHMVALLDVARIGPDYLPGHAHADTLTFELSLNGQRLIVNSGTSEYGTGPERLRQRSTSAHNTVEINDQNSSEVWSGFRVAQRAYPIDTQTSEPNGSIEVRAAHGGYRRLPGQPVHRRLWRLSDRSLSVHDIISGKFQTAIARYHLHPDVKAECNGRQGRLILPKGQRIDWTVTAGDVEITKSTWHPEFGKSIPSLCLEISFSNSECSIEFTW